MAGLHPACHGSIVCTRDATDPRLNGTVVLSKGEYRGISYLKITEEVEFSPLAFMLYMRWSEIEEAMRSEPGTMAQMTLFGYCTYT